VDLHGCQHAGIALDDEPLSNFRARYLCLHREDR
jgi:hypothetical protein